RRYARSGPDPEQSSQRLLRPRLERSRRSGAGQPGRVPHGPEPRRQAGGLPRSDRRVHAGRPGRDCLHLESAGGAAAGDLRLPAEARLGPRGGDRPLLRSARAPVERGISVKRSALAAVLLISGCGYFNALYHAERRFDEAERAVARGEHTRADDAYAEAIERAASSYRRYPDGRWADDALYVIVRSRFGRGEYAAARVAAMRLAEMTGDEQVRLGARAYEGAALVRLDSAAAALPPLDAVVDATRADRDLGAFARLWRARARFALADTAGGWADLADAAA